MFAGFDPDVVPAVQLQTAAADHHVEAEQGEGLRGGRAPAGVQEGKRRGRLFTPPPHLSPARPLTAFLSLSLSAAGGRSVGRRSPMSRHLPQGDGDLRALGRRAFSHRIGRDESRDGGAERDVFIRLRHRHQVSVSLWSQPRIVDSLA